jgi:hypothetical protein
MPRLSHVTVAVTGAAAPRAGAASPPYCRRVRRGLETLHCGMNFRSEKEVVLLHLLEHRSVCSGVYDHASDEAAPLSGGGHCSRLGLSLLFFCVRKKVKLATAGGSTR